MGKGALALAVTFVAHSSMNGLASATARIVSSTSIV
jgi:hypothetical protein